MYIEVNRLCAETRAAAATTHRRRGTTPKYVSHAREKQSQSVLPYHATRTFFPALVLTVEEKEVALDMKTQNSRRNGKGRREKHKNIFFKFGIPHLCHRGILQLNLRVVSGSLGVFYFPDPERL
jgi:hypothetical protein